MQFTQAQLNEHIELARAQLKNEVVGMLESYAEGCREQALAQVPSHTNTDHLHGSLSACQFMAAVIRAID
jgi:hypothetical protein